MKQISLTKSKNNCPLQDYPPQTQVKQDQVIGFSLWFIWSIKIFENLFFIFFQKFLNQIFKEKNFKKIFQKNFSKNFSKQFFKKNFQVNDSS